MLWDEDYTSSATKRSVGRPTVNPFPTTASEEEFVRCATAMLERYHRPKGSGSRLDFVFDDAGKYAMSKTQFWAIIYLYYVENKGLNENLDGFINIIQEHFGTQVVSDRTSVSKNVKMQKSLYVTSVHAFELTNASAQAQKKYRAQYQFVVRRWDEVGADAAEYAKRIH